MNFCRLAIVESWANIQIFALWSINWMNWYTRNSNFPISQELSIPGLTFNTRNIHQITQEQIKVLPKKRVLNFFLKGMQDRRSEAFKNLIFWAVVSMRMFY